jgi:hypothetical protein
MYGNDYGMWTANDGERYTKKYVKSVSRFECCSIVVVVINFLYLYETILSEFSHASILINDSVFLWCARLTILSSAPHHHLNV